MARIPQQPTAKPWSLQHMWERHHQMKRLFVMGLTNKEIAEQVGLSESRVSIIRHSPAFASELDKLSAQADMHTLDVQAELGREALKSYQLLSRVRDGELTQDVKVRVQVAQDLLNRAGYSGIQKHAVAHLDVEAIERIKQMARPASSEQMIEADATVE